MDANKRIWLEAKTEEASISAPAVVAFEHITAVEMARDDRWTVQTVDGSQFSVEGEGLERLKRLVSGEPEVSDDAGVRPL